MTGRSSRTNKSELVICTYRIKDAHEDAFLKLLARHWPTLRRQGLATAEPALIYRGVDETKNPFFVEIFTWQAGGAAKAHEDPVVMRIWEGMGIHTEERLGRPAMEFPHVQPVRLRFAKV